MILLKMMLLLRASIRNYNYASFWHFKIATIRAGISAFANIYDYKRPTPRPSLPPRCVKAISLT